MNKGLYPKYIITRTDGKPLSGKRYFVLSFDSKDEHHRAACRMAARVYADAIEAYLPQLAADLRNLVGEDGSRLSRQEVSGSKTLNPVCPKCGFGELRACEDGESRTWGVQCPKCDIKLDGYESEQELISFWNADRKTEKQRDLYRDFAGAISWMGEDLIARRQWPPQFQLLLERWKYVKKEFENYLIMEQLGRPFSVRIPVSATFIPRRITVDVFDHPSFPKACNFAVVDSHGNCIPYAKRPYVARAGNNLFWTDGDNTKPLPYPVAELGKFDVTDWTDIVLERTKK